MTATCHATTVSRSTIPHSGRAHNTTVMTETAPFQAWGALIAWLAEVVVALVALGAFWAERARQRRRLMALDDRMLSDVGLDRVRAEAEYEKPFWRD